MIPLLLSLIAHVLADFIWQTDTTVARKNQLKIGGFVGHGLIIYGTLAVLLSTYRPGQVLGYALFITLVHLGIDWGKVLLVTHFQSPQAKLGAFVGDQLCHVVVLLGIWQHFNWQTGSWLTGFWDLLFSPRLAAVFSAPPGVMEGLGAKILLVILAYLTICWGGVVLVGQFLDLLTAPKENSVCSRGMQRAGRCIGIIERGLILTLTLNNSLTAVVFVFTAKSIARFRELDDRSFAEYYLVGTLLSTAIAVGGGLLVRLALKKCF
ncbi:MAG: DUF3307 domain-containing protein [Bacillota bacterium]|jgi:hypothetical protein